MTVLDLPRSLPVSAAAVATAARRAHHLAEEHREAAAALRRVLTRLAPLWRGTGARAALEELTAVADDGRRLADAHERTAEALARCAARLEHADDLLRQAEVADRLDRANKAALQGVTAPLPPWLEDTPLRRRAVRLLAEAQAEQDAAVRQAAVVLSEVAADAPRPPARDRHGFDPLDQLLDVPRGFAASVVDTARTAWRLSPVRLTDDPTGWFRDARATADGVEALLRDPLAALPQLLGLDLLSDGQYGTWVGAALPDLVSGMGSGGAVPAGRRALGVADELADLAEDVDELQRVTRRLPGAGGPVVPRDGADMQPGMVAHVADLSPQRRIHILEGDETGGGHRHGTGKPRKTEFPASWSDEKIIDVVMDTAMHPQKGWDEGERYRVHAVHEGYTIRVVVEKATNEIITAYPIDGPGVVRNPSRRAARD